ncbi:MAG: HD domain-containing protein [Chlorobi bacterium]|nr:HD domain-containing protein [Chlorobiota bacterium]
MSFSLTNKRKIFNDPVYGFISISNELIFDLIEHPYFQRLRRIKQLGLTHLVYPGALHTRFHHSLGAMYLMQRAIAELRAKGHEITADEALGAEIAILLHDIGHGPYSHALEYAIVDGVSHEELSRFYIQRFNRIFDGGLSVAFEIFEKKYLKQFLGKMVSSQLDVDRLDYLKRDSFFTGVAEGVINFERLLNMLDVLGDDLVVEAKGIYSVEKFITARRLMYWQVYLHKTVLAAEYMMMRLLKRAKYLSLGGEKLFASPALSFFLTKKITLDDFNNDTVINTFSELDDYDILGAMKVWKNHKDKVISFFSRGLVDRKLFRIELQNNPFEEHYILEIRKKVIKKYKLTDEEADYFIINDSTSNYAYKPDTGEIEIVFKDGSVKNIGEATEDLNISLLSKPVTKYFLCYPKEIT